jgi:hypothetical protein
MAGGITRTHGALVAPQNFAGVALQDFTLTFWSGNVQAGGSAALSTDYNGGAGTPAGALDAIFRTAVGTVGTVSRVGTLSTATRTLRFAIEVLGLDSVTNGYLGGGLYSNNPDNLTASTATSAALQAAIQSLGTINSVHLSSATVAAFAY